LLIANNFVVNIKLVSLKKLQYCLNFVAMLKQLKPPKFKAALKFYKSRILKKQNLRNYAYGDFKLNDLCVKKNYIFFSRIRAFLPVNPLK
jgi:hypothetical protein